MSQRTIRILHYEKRGDWYISTVGRGFPEFAETMHQRVEDIVEEKAHLVLSWRQIAHPEQWIAIDSYNPTKAP